MGTPATAVQNMIFKFWHELHQFRFYHECKICGLEYIAGEEDTWSTIKFNQTYDTIKENKITLFWFEVNGFSLLFDGLLKKRRVMLPVHKKYQ